MPRGKHTRCSQCRCKGEYQHFEVMWHVGFSGPWHYVGGWLCAACRGALLEFINQIGVDVIAWDG